SGSKAGLLLGVFAGLVMISAIAAGAGWFAYKTYYQAKPAATPVVPALPATPTPGQVLAADVNANSNSVATELVDPYNAAANRKPATMATPDATVSKTQPRVLPPATPTRTQKPPTRPTPKPPARDDRTVILQ
ncbi:MAG: hypothetical protein ABIV21_01810, partial [Pyrinomonadaceae bacterium]